MAPRLTGGNDEIDGGEATFGMLDAFALDETSIAGKLWLAAAETSGFNWTISRDTIQPGRSISREAMDAVMLQVGAWVEARILERWRRTGEPPTIVSVSVSVDAQ